MKSLRRISTGVILMSSVAACTLPRGAAMRSEIVGSSTSTTQNFSHYEIDRSLLPVVASWPAGEGVPPSTGWPQAGKAGPAGGQILAAGDMVHLAVWENGDNKLLTDPGAPSTQLQMARISPSGNIFVPYVGAVKVAGLSPERARERIQSSIAKLIPAAQVQIEAQPGTQNSVDLVGGVARPGAFPLTDRSLTVLGLVSLGGGATPDIQNPQLRLIRKNKGYTISMQKLLDDPALDIPVDPGDKLMVQKDKRSFLALGASGREQIMYFPKDQMTALEAVTMMGGINPGRADPKGVLILRQYAASAVRPDGQGGPAHQRVVFSINLTTTDGLFSARNFAIQPDDLVLVTESPIVKLQTILSLASSSATTTVKVNDLSD